MNQKKSANANPQIIFQDESFMIVNKPAGWIVNDANTAKNQAVLQTWIKNNFDFEIAKSFDHRSGIVHRLDKETSGVLVIARTILSFEKLQSEFKERLVNKTYLALVHGVLESQEGTIDAPVGRLPWRRDRFGVLSGGREAQTSYKVLNNFTLGDEKFSLVELYPKTGRTHQIRIHMKHLGHALVSDEFYAGRKTARHDRVWCPRLFLHASKIDFLHPKSGARVSFEAPLHEDLQMALTSLHCI